MALFQQSPDGQFSSNAYCDIGPLEETNMHGLTVVTKCDMRIYRWRPEQSDAKPGVLAGYNLTVDKITLDGSLNSFIPTLDGMTDIQDYRSARGREDYLSDHWLDPGKTTRNAPIPVVLGPLGKDVNDTRTRAMETRQPRLVRKNAPPFQAQTLMGLPVQFPGDYKGKLVLLDFWATWCGPCVAELPNVSAAYEKFSSRGVEFLGVSLDKTDAVEKLGAFCQVHKMAWPEICDGKEWDAEIAKLYSVESIPMSFLVDGDTGRVLLEGDALRGEQLIPALGQALKNKKP
jgi:thiol-disulfide isomerase/thioredoxin